MTVVTMPDGVPVEFPDEMPPEHIKALIAEKFPDHVQKHVRSLGNDPAIVPPGTTGVEDIGRGRAIGIGALQGTAANLGDEFIGAQAASGRPIPPVVPFAPMANALIGLYRMGYEKLTNKPNLSSLMTGEEPKGEATKRYEETRDAVRELVRDAEEQYPGSYLAGNVGGAILSPAAKAKTVAQGASWLQRAKAVAGAGGRYGAIAGAGEGETLPERAQNAAIGGPVGYVAGGVLSPVADVAGKAAGATGRYIHNAVGSPFSTLAQWANSEGVGNRAVAAVIRNAERTGDKTAITAAEYERRLAAGEPVTLLDRAGDQGRNLARAVKNEPAAAEGRQALQEMTNERFLDQNVRFADDVRQLSVGNRRLTNDELLDAAAPANSANYKAAHNQAQSVITQRFNEGKPGGLDAKPFKDLLQSPIAQRALAPAAEREANRTVVEGVLKGRGNMRARAFPLEIERGPNNSVRVSLRESSTGGSTSVLDLHAVDAVSRALRGAQGEAVRAGNKEVARDITILRNAWLKVADEQVPLYAKARGDAMKAFKVRGFGDDVENAYQAGQSYIQKMGLGGRIGRNDLAKLESIIGQFSPAEKELFRRGAGEQLAYLLEQVPKHQDVVPKILASEVAVRQMEVAFGKPAVRRLVARRDIEKIEEFGRKAVMGNSTTELQQSLRAVGLGGIVGTSIGVGGAAASGNDPLKAGGAVGSIWSALALTNRQVQRQVGAKVFDHIGKLLASGSPANLEQATQIIVRNEKLYNAVRQIASSLERSGAGTAASETAPQISQRVPLMIGRAGEGDEPVR